MLEKQLLRRVSPGEVSAYNEWRENKVAEIMIRGCQEQGEQPKAHPIQLFAFKDEAQRIQLTHPI